MIWKEFFICFSSCQYYTTALWNTGTVSKFASLKQSRRRTSGFCFSQQLKLPESELRHGWHRKEREQPSTINMLAKPSTAMFLFPLLLLFFFDAIMGCEKRRRHEGRFNFQLEMETAAGRRAGGNGNGLAIKFWGWFNFVRVIRFRRESPIEMNAWK